MSKQETSANSYCEVCGIDVRQDADLKRFGKFFCSKEHMETYVKAKQRELGLEQGSQERRERRGFRGC